MTITLLFLILVVPFALAAVLSRVARRSECLRAHLDRFRAAAATAGRAPDDRDVLRVLHDAEAIRTRFDCRPISPTSHATGEPF